MKRLGEKIRNRREEIGIGQEELGNLVGVSRRSIAAYEAGEKTPRQGNMTKLSQALGVTERYLMNDDCADPEAGIDEEPFIREAREKFGKKGAEEMAETLRRNEALFAGGTLSEDQKDMFYEAVTKAYFMNKQHAREKFARKHPRKD